MATNFQTSPGFDPGVVHRILSAASLKGTKVHNFAGEDLGKVDDFILNLDSGRIAYVVISLGGFLGIGDRLHAVPWELFSTAKQDHDLFIDVEKQMLIDSPYFERSAWPAFDDPEWSAGIHAHYAQKPYWNSDITDAGDYAGDDRIDKPDRDRI